MIGMIDFIIDFNDIIDLAITDIIRFVDFRTGEAERGENTR